MKPKNISLCFALFLSFVLPNQLYPNFPGMGDDELSMDQEYVNIARNYKQDGDTKKAVKYFKKAAELNPENRAACFELGGILYGEKQYDEAFKYYKKTCDIDSRCSQAYYNAALCLTQKEKTDQATEYLKKAIELNPEYTRAYRQLGSIYRKKKRYNEAVKYFQIALERKPDSVDIISQLGKSLKGADKLEESLEYLEKALEIKPNDLSLMLDVANTYNMLNRNEESIEMYQKILEIKPNLHQIQYNYAFTLKKMGRYEEAVNMFQNILEKYPDYANAHFSLALAYLALGDFDAGWPEYEYRWAAYKETPRKYEKPLWDGSNPEGKTIFLYAEQGLGDTFQFVRYAHLIKHLGGNVVVQTQKPLAQILSLCKYIDKVVPRGKPIPHFDYYLPLMSLPLAFKTTVDTVPANIPYLFADPQLVEYWKEKLSADKNFKIGICWQGNPKYRTQALRHAVAAKSMHVSIFEPIANIPGVSLYNLQKMGGEEQLNEINFKVHTFGPDFDDSHGRFMDTAAIMKNLDLIITVDTSTAHLAAGLGTKTWIMLPEPSDWRWMIDTLETPWYPNARLFRQPKLGDWESVIADITKKLCKKLNVAVQTKQKSEKLIEPSSAPATTKRRFQTTKKPVEIPSTPAVTKSRFTSPTYKAAPQKKDDAIRFVDMEDVAFEEILDKLIIMKIKYDETQDPKLFGQMGELKKKIEKLERMYSKIKSSPDLDDLTEELYEINKKLWKIEKKVAEKGTASMFDDAFIKLTRKAHNIHKLKAYVKEQIREAVRPDAC